VSVTKAPEFLQDTGASTWGNQDVPFAGPGGEIRAIKCAPAEAMAVNLVKGEGAPPTGVLALTVDNPEQAGDLVGVYAPLDPASLRTLAATCMRIAEVIDGGRGKQ
jgi:hypothetical protein